MSTASGLTPRDLILTQTVVTAPFLCPELRLHLVTETCALWRATEADLARWELPPPFWAFCWPGGQALSRYVLDHPEETRGRRVLDFGAGCGIEALAALKAGALHALGADIDPYALEAMTLNAALNEVSLEVTGEDLIGVEGEWDVVLVGDMFFELELADRVFPWLRRLAARGSRVLLGDPHRGFLPAGHLRPVAFYLAPSDVDIGGLYLKPTTVFEVLP